MKNILPQKSKRGVTLVECVIAVAVLGLLAVGVLNLLTAGGTKIAQLSTESADQAKATQILDLAISTISNGSDKYIIKSSGEITTCHLNTKALMELHGFVKVDGDEDEYVKDGVVVSISVKCSLYGESAPKDALNGSSYIDYPLTDIRGWYLTLTYTGQSGKPITVTGFASNSEGVFDQQ